MFPNVGGAEWDDIRDGEFLFHRNGGVEEDVITPNNGSAPALAFDRGFPDQILAFTPFDRRISLICDTIPKWTSPLRPIGVRIVSLEAADKEHSHQP
jgi:hypothetical protein